MKALVVHGPTLDLLGRRDPAVYGSDTLAEIDRLLRAEASDLGVELDIRQSAREGEIVELLVAGVDRLDGAVVNPAAYSHTSRAIADAIEAVPYPVIEVHLSNILAREPWRRTSVTAEACRAVVMGLGARSYVLALGALTELVEE